MGQATKGVLFIVGAIVILVILAGALLIRQAAPTFPETITDVSQYEEILDSFPISGLADHFPKTIPANAKNLRMDYYPGCMMGGGNFELKLTLPAKEIEQIFTKYNTIATHHYRAGDTTDHSEQPTCPPIPHFYTGDTELPNSFEILVLGSKPYVEGDWDKGESYGLAIDLSSSEVVYWAEWW